MGVAISVLTFPWLRVVKCEQEPDSSRGWALVFLEGFVKERVRRVASCGGSSLEGDLIFKAKGVPYGHLKDR